MSMRSTLFLLLLCLVPLLLSAAPGAGPPDYSSSQDNAQTLPATTTAKSPNNSATPNCTDAIRKTTGATYPSCWDTLQMNQWMFNWNFTTTSCEDGEIWSTCFLRLAYGSARYDCSRLGSLNCSEPQLGGSVTDARVFYGAFNIYGKRGLTYQMTNTDLVSSSQPSIPTSARGKRPYMP